MQHNGGFRLAKKFGYQPPITKSCLRKMRLGNFALRREGHKLILSNIPERWHDHLKFAGIAIFVVEFTIALIGVYTAIVGFPFSLPVVTLILALIAIFELGRPDIEIKYNMTYTSPPMSVGPGGPSSWSHDPPIEMVSWNYIDSEGESIPDDDLGLHGSETVEIQIPEGNRQMLGESNEASFSIGLPYSVRNITFSGEGRASEFEVIENGQSLENQQEVEEALVRNEASLSFVLPREEIHSMGRIFRADAADDSKSVEFVATEDTLEYRYTQDDYAHTIDVKKSDLPAGEKYHVILQWKPGELNLHVGPITQEE